MSARRQQGAMSVMYFVALPVVAAIMGLALDLSLAFQRRAQLQQLVDVAAVIAAQQLNDGSDGITLAHVRAAAIVTFRYVRGTPGVTLPTAALTFATAPTGPWVSYASAQASPAGLRYVRVDAAALDAAHTSIPSLFGTLLNSSGSTTLGASAVAGPNALNVLPLAICAASSTPLATRANGSGVNEIVQYGFRHGVGYNLLALNPAAGASGGEYFLIDPASPAGSTALAASTDDANVAPFMCTGKLAYASLEGALHLRRNGSFGLWQQLNSRFGDNSSSLACDDYSAPPDTNVREYFGATASWMNSAPPQASAASSTQAAGKPLQTIADGAPPLPAVAAAQYGTLWAYGAARSSLTATISPSKWSVLYPATPALAASGWPAAGPYATQTTAPAGLVGRKERRLLYVPLLSCPIPAGTHVSGTVLAVARFLLTARASATVVPGEFAGILSASELAKLGSDVELLR